MMMGWDDAKIMETLSSRYKPERVKEALRNAHRDETKQDARNDLHVPHVAYTRDSGERMWEMLPGHVIGEKSLEAFGYAIPHTSR